MNSILMLKCTVQRLSKLPLTHHPFAQLHPVIPVPQGSRDHDVFYDLIV